VGGAAAHAPSPLILRTTGHSDRREESLTKTTSFSLQALPVFSLNGNTPRILENAMLRANLQIPISKEIVATLFIPS